MSSTSNLPSHETTQPVADQIPVSGSTANTISATSSQPSRSRAICRFHHTKQGCRAGDQCRYRHVDRHPAAPAEAQSPDPTSNSTEAKLPQRPRSTAPRQVVQKPVPAKQQINPRDFQISQIVRRFSPQRQGSDHGTVLTFKFEPSDPDFPFDLPGGLQCILTVPDAYPQNGKPSIRVSNKIMPRGYQINIERGFDSLVEQAPKKTLLALFNDLDRHLEEFLTSEKAQTLKISANAPSKPIQPEPGPVRSVPKPVPSEPVLPPPPFYTSQQKAEARQKRDADVRQLEARMSKLPLYSKSADGTIYNVPVQISKPARLPVSLQAVKELVLFVPPLYNLEPCTVHLKGIESQESQNVEMAFEKHARQEAGLTLMAHINYLTVNMHNMAAEVATSAVPVEMSVPVVDDVPDESHAKATESLEQLLDADRPHLRVIPRPPEWDQPDGDSDELSSDYTDSDEYTESEDEDAEATGGASLPASALASTSDHGIALSFPDVELYGIELFEIATLGLSLKCLRCKTTVDVPSLKPSNPTTTNTVSQSCPKCAYELTASFTPTAVHANNVRAAHLTLTSCTPLDMLPSTFTPTCSTCSTPFPTSSGNGITSVRGSTTLTICRHCHAKMTFLIPTTKFLRLSATAGAPLPNTQPRRRNPKENLGITTGTPLPSTGRCAHYRKSLRWFRFSCCDKVFPCDRCHDEQVAPKHPNEHANRMICGFCSREQNYRPEDCGVCGRGLVGRKGGGFWEGGKGTRDKVRMSRKEKRKYKRVGGGGGGS